MTLRVTWWGHATLLLTDRATLLTDPVLTGSLAHLHRRAGLAPGRLTARPDAVLISHLHADHLHLPSLALVPAGTPVLLPRGGGRLLRRLPLEPVEVTAGEVVAVGDAQIEVVPADHTPDRWPVGGAHGDPVGYLVRGDHATYFAGDTRPFPEMAGLGAPLDLALLPVAGWGPWLRGGHLTPRTAAGCLAALAPRVAVPIHYGTFWPRGLSKVRPRVFHGPGHEFAAHAQVLAPGVDVRVLAPGTSTQIEVRPSEEP